MKETEGKSLTAGGKWRAIAFETRGVYCVEWSDIQSVTQHGVRSVQCQV